jgi:signal transduction histidine kinase
MRGVRDAAGRHNARLLAATLVVIVPLGAVSVAIQLAVVPGFVPTGLVVAGALGILVAAYALLRAGRDPLAAALAAGVPVAAALLAAAVNPRDPVALAFPLIGVLVASLLLPRRAALAFAAATMAGVIAVAAARPVVPGGPGSAVGLVMFVGIGAALIVLGARHRERLEAERHAELVVADRLAAIGTLSASVVHELANPLTLVAANLDLLAQRTREHGATTGVDADLLAAARAGVDRMVTSLRGLRRFARLDGGDGPADVRGVLESVIAMAEIQIRHRARLVLELGAVPTARAGAAPLEQVFLNLLLNAIQAIPEGTPDRHEIRVRLGLDQRGRVEVSVRDTGEGIPPELLGRIFEPFFTTKPRGDGTGLGLAVCRRIVARLGGEITVESEVGVGTTVRVGLPAGDPQPAA